IERGVDRGKTAIDLGLGGRERHAVEQRMRKRVVGDGMTLAQRAAASCGCASALRPSKKNDAPAHSRLSVSRTRAVLPGPGPSSKVSTTSLGASGRVS